MTTCLSTNGGNVHGRDADPNRLVVATVDGIAVLAREGGEGPWTIASRALEAIPVSALIRDPRSGRIFAGAHSGGLYFSAGDGSAFRRLAGPLENRHVYSLRCIETDDIHMLLAGTEPVGLWRSDDGGQNWRELPAIAAAPNHARWSFPEPPHFAHTKSIAADPRDPDVLYVGVEQGGLLKTADGGASWRELDGFFSPDDPVYKDIHQVVLRPSNPDEIFMTSGTGLYHSEDRGEHWEHLTDSSFMMAYPDQLILSPLDEGVLFMSGAAKTPRYWRGEKSAAGTVLASHDSGRSWQRAGEGLPVGNRSNIEAMSIAATANGFALFAGDTDGAVWYSGDNGENWSRIASGLAPISKPAHYAHIEGR